MAFVKWLVGGLAGGAIGGVVWVLISHYLNFEVGYVAVLIGVLTGLGVRMSSRYDAMKPTRTQSVLACLVAAAMVLGSKYVVANLALDKELANVRVAQNELVDAIDEEARQQAAQRQEFIDSLPEIKIEKSELPLRLARNEAQRREENDEQLAWPEGQSIETAETESDFPPEVIEWARQQIANMSDAEIEAAIAREEELLNSLVKALKSAAEEQQADTAQAAENDRKDQQDNQISLFDRFEYFMDSLSWFDLLWILLAMASAYKISADDESNVPPAEV